jgi:hypothetical protein
MCRANWDPCPRAAWAVGCAAPLQRTSAPPPAARSSGTGTGRPVGVGTLGSARSDSELLVVHATERTASHTLLQNMSIVLTGNVSLVSAHQTDIKKGL